MWVQGLKVCVRAIATVGGLLLLTQLAWGDENGNERTLSPYFAVAGGDGEAFPLKSTAVTANVSGSIADVIVTQIYRNTGVGPIDARYVFPASTRAAVHGLQVTIGNRRVVARIKERLTAAKEYEAAKQAGKNAALLEEQRPNVFTMSVANIMPGDEVIVVLEYSELLVPEAGVYEFVYPTVVGPRYSHTDALSAPPTEAFVSSPYLHSGVLSPSTFAISVNVSPGLPVTDLRSSSHEVNVEWDSDSTARVRSIDAGSGNRDFILDYRLSGNQIQSGVLTSDADGSPGSENFFLLTVQPPRTVTNNEIVPRDYIFVLDVSGSMYGFPLDTAKTLIKNLIGGLRDTDTFDVVLFSGDARLLTPTPMPANQRNITNAIAAIDAERGGGGTELAGALAMAMSVPEGELTARSVVVITDGFIAEEPEALNLINGHLQRCNFFAFGIGASVNRYLIEGIARAGQGEPFVVTKPEEAAAVAEKFRQYIAAPVLTDIRVAYNGFDAYDLEPAVQPDLFADRPITLTGKWHGPLVGDIVITGKTASSSFTRTIHLLDATPSGGSTLAQLWARTRIARLSDFGFERNDAAAVSEVTRLGLDYSLLTKYTSFIAVFEAVRNPGGALSVDQPLPMPQNVADTAVGYGSGAEPELWVIAACALLGAFLLMRRSKSWARDAARGRA